MTRRSASTAGRIAIAAAAGAAAIALWLRRRRAAAAAAGPHSPPARREWRCRCGQAFVVAGLDRHRVYWPSGAAETEPLLENECPNCGAPLPARHESAVA